MNLRSILGGDVASLDPASPRFVTGSLEDQRQARAEWLQGRFAAEVMRSGLREIPRSSLTQLRFGVLEDDAGEFYRARRDGLVDFSFVGAEVVAYFVGSDEIPVLLERPSGPQNRDELEAYQAERERRRNAPKRRPAWMDQAHR